MSRAASRARSRVAASPLTSTRSAKGLGGTSSTTRIVVWRPPSRKEQTASLPIRWDSPAARVRFRRTRRACPCRPTTRSPGDVAGWSGRQDSRAGQEVMLWRLDSAEASLRLQAAAVDRSVSRREPKPAPKRNRRTMIATPSASPLSGRTRTAASGPGSQLFRCLHGNRARSRHCSYWCETGTCRRGWHLSRAWGRPLCAPSPNSPRTPHRPAA